MERECSIYITTFVPQYKLLFSRQKKKSVHKYNPHFKLLDTFIYFFQIHTINTTKCFGRWGVRVEHIHKQNGILGTSIHKIDTLNTIPTFFLFWYNTTHFCFVSRELPTFFIFLIYVKIAKGAYNNGQMYDIYIYILRDEEESHYTSVTIG